MEKTINTEQVKALMLIDRFNPKCGLENRAFPLIQKDEFVSSFKALIHNPVNISQGIHPLCGIASAIKIAARLDPVGLVKMGAHFFARGSYSNRALIQKPIKVPSKLKGMKNGHGLSAAGFVLQATIKSFYNPLTGYNNQPGTKYNEWQGITFPHQVCRFLKSYFNIQRLPARTFGHTVEEIQGLLNQKAMVMAWTSWNQMKNPGGKFKLFEQHYVLIKEVRQDGEKVELLIDNPRKGEEDPQEFIFQNKKQFYKAIIGIYAFKGAGTK